MSRPFSLEVITPEQAFLKTQVEALTLQLPDGEMTVLAGHEPLVANIGESVAKLKLAEGWKNLVCSPGFLEVRPDEALLFVQDCAWPENAQERSAREAEAIARDKLLRRQSVYEHRAQSINLGRMLSRLQKKTAHKAQD